MYTRQKMFEFSFEIVRWKVNVEDLPPSKMTTLTLGTDRQLEYEYVSWVLTYLRNVSRDVLPLST